MPLNSQDHDLLVRLDTKMDVFAQGLKDQDLRQITALNEHKVEQAKVNDDHEQRQRRVERLMWRVSGGLTVLVFAMDTGIIIALKMLH